MPHSNSTRPTPIRTASVASCARCDSLTRERAALQLEQARTSAALAASEGSLEMLRAENAALRQSVAQLAEQVATMEADGADLVKLHVSHCRLHESHGRADVLIAVEEIIVSVIGCERYAIFDASGGDLTPVASMGLHARELQPVPRGLDTLARVAHSGVAHLPDPDDDVALLGDAEEPVACVPIRERDGHVTGLIALHELLPHKASLDITDRALLDLLSVEAARALRDAPRRQPA